SPSASDQRGSAPALHRSSGEALSVKPSPIVSVNASSSPTPTPLSDESARASTMITAPWADPAPKARPKARAIGARAERPENNKRILVLLNGGPRRAQYAESRDPG